MRVTDKSGSDKLKDTILSLTMQHGFRIEQIIDTTTWRTLIPFKWPLEECLHCPIDASPFQVIASVASCSQEQRIRIGTCPSCGLTGYMDRPTQESMNQYYRDEWMDETVEQAIDKGQQQRATLNFGEYQQHLHSALDIGCGYGAVVKALLDSGIEHVDGIENCPARAAATRSLHGVEVFEGDITIPGILPERNYDLVFSFHVIEHTFNPDLMMQTIASHQQAGGLLKLAMPLFETEPAMATVLFLPHLWSFTKVAVKNMLAKHGYEIVEDASETTIEIIAQKMATSKVTPLSDINFVESAVDKLRRGLGLVPDEASVLTWQRDCDGAVRSSPYYARGEMTAPHPRRVLITDIEQAVTDAPVEIQFQDDIQMFVK